MYKSIQTSIQVQGYLNEKRHTEKRASVAIFYLMSTRKCPVVIALPCIVKSVVVSVCIPNTFRHNYTLEAMRTSEISRSKDYCTVLRLRSLWLENINCIQSLLLLSKNALFKSAFYPEGISWEFGLIVPFQSAKIYFRYLLFIACFAGESY